MGKLLKDRVAENKESIRDADYQIDLLKTKIDTQQSYIRKLKEQNDDTIATFQSLIIGAEEEIKAIKKDSEDVTQKLEFLHEDISSLKVDENKKAKLVDIHNRMLRKIKNAEKQIKFFNDNAECPTCSQDINDTIRNDRIESLNKSIVEVQAGDEQLSKQMQELDTKITSMLETQNTINILQTKYIENNSILNSLYKTIQKNQQEIEKIENTGVDSVETYEKLKLYEDDKRLNENRKEELVNDRELYGVAVNMLKDDGIKKKIIKQYVPVMNKLINKYLAALDFFVLFELDEQFNEVIKSRHRDEFSYASFSEGEKMRIDLALLFTWRSIAKLKNSINTNLLILDEVFDASLDNNGCDEFLKLLNQLDNQTNVFVISHKGDILSEKFKHQIRFEKYKNFSRVA